MRRLLLVRHAPSAATRAGAFPPMNRSTTPAGAPPERLDVMLPRDASVFTSPAIRCLETAATDDR